MKTVIAGEHSKVDFLIRSLLEKKHKATIIDDEEVCCRYLSKKYNIPVVMGNPCRWHVLKKVEIDHTDILIVLCPGDPDNLTIYQIVKKMPHVKRAAVTASNPRNVPVPKKLGVDTTIPAMYTITKITEQASTIGNLVNSSFMEQENIVLNELLLTGKCAIVNKKPKESPLPRNVIICCTLRNVDMVISSGETVLQEHDKLLLPCSTAL